MSRVLKTSRAAAVAPPDGVSPSVLVVDTNEDCARSLAELLEFCGYTVSVAIDGRMALALADPLPDIIITELALPDLDGFELIRQLRARAGNKTQFVIAVSSRQCADNRGTPVKIDLNYVKPADPKVLMPALARFARSLGTS
jgi:DNA-binding response OmpR family regulator